MQNQKIVVIHPFDFGALFASDETGAEAVIRKDGLVDFNGKVYKQSTEIGYKPENAPEHVRKRFDKRIADLKAQDEQDEASLAAEKAELKRILRETSKK